MDSFAARTIASQYRDEKFQKPEEEEEGAPGRAVRISQGWFYDHIDALLTIYPLSMARFY